MNARTATLTRVESFNSFVGLNRREWVLTISDGTTKRTRTRREAVEWAADMGIQIEQVSG